VSDPAENIRRQMRSIRREMGADVQDIVSSARELSDWRYYVRRYPWLSAGVAFALGLAIAPKRRRPASPIKTAPKPAVDEHRVRKLVSAALGRAPAESGLGMKLLALVGPMALRTASNAAKRTLEGARGGRPRPEARSREERQHV
jgi:hypothetical protein